MLKKTKRHARSQPANSRRISGRRFSPSENASAVCRLARSLLVFFFFFFLYQVKKLSWARKTSQLHENPADVNQVELLQSRKWSGKKPGHSDEVFLIEGTTLVAITALQGGGRVEEKEA